MPYYISPPPQSPLSKIIAAIIAAFALVGSLVIGAAALLAIAGVALIAGISIWLRVAWIKRRWQKSGLDFGPRVDASGDSGQVIDAEYTVISSSEDHAEK